MLNPYSAHTLHSAHAFGVPSMCRVCTEYETRVHARIGRQHRWHIDGIGGIDGRAFARIYLPPMAACAGIIAHPRTLVHWSCEAPALTLLPRQAMVRRAFVRLSGPAVRIAAIRAVAGPCGRWGPTARFPVNRLDLAAIPGRLRGTPA